MSPRYFTEETDEVKRTAAQNTPQQILAEIPEDAKSYEKFESWILGNIPSRELTAEDCANIMRASDRAVAMGGSREEYRPGWAFFVDSSGDLRAWTMGTEIKKQAEASQMLTEDLRCDGLSIIAMLAEDQPQPVNPEPLTISSNREKNVSNDEENEKGLYDKFEVKKDGNPVNNCFVLRPESDPAARDAIRSYAENTDNETLAEDLHQWIDDIENEEN